MDNFKSKTKQELQEYIELQYKNLESANKRIDELEAENNLLRQQQEFVAQRGYEPEKSQEQLICELEIAKLYEEAKNRTLTSAETKQLEIYIKSLHLCKSKNKKPEPKDVTSEEISDSDLIKYALIKNE